MKRNLRHTARWVMALGWLAGSGQRPVSAQLAITEAMSVPSSSFGAQSVAQNSDFWELTNFGTNTIDLTGYRWNDKDGGLYSGPNLSADPLPFLGLSIGGGESIVFVQYNPITNAQQFRDWWGPRLPANLQIVFYASNGFNGTGDGIRLWGPEATNNADVVDTVDFGDAGDWRGHSITYDPETGLFGAWSRAGANGAFQAATRDDHGSPGWTTGPVHLSILEQPTNLLLCAGLDARFVVRAVGLPHPRYQWLFHGNPIAGANSSTLVIPNVQLANIGAYEVEIANGLTHIRSAAATLSVSTMASAPNLFRPLADASVLIGETARFGVEVCAFPPPAFQWLSNGVPLPGENGRTLVIPRCPAALSGSSYCVRVANSNGALTACATLHVTPKPRLLITEVMASPGTNCPEEALHDDWFELTNADTNSVNLQGYRFANDRNLEGAYVVDQPLLLAPGQSAIFVGKMTPAAFRKWWGAEALPPGLPIIRVPALGLKIVGEEIYFWSPGVEDEFSPDSTVISKSYAFATRGVTFRFEEDEADPCYWGCESVPGEFGAFRAAECGDIGSPGYTTNPPPRLTSISRDASGVTVRWRAVEGRSYRLSCKNQLSEPSWTPLSTHTATGAVGVAQDTPPFGTAQRFYRVEELP